MTRSRFGLVKSMNRIPTCGLRRSVPEREVGAVAVVAREGERVLVDDPHESGLAALVGALRHAVLVGGREEEHVAGLDERAVVVVEAIVAEPLLDPVGEAARVEAVLQLPVPVVVEVGHSEMMRSMAPRVHLTNGVLAEVERELEPDFELVASPVGADGIVAVLNVVIDDAYLEAAGPQLRIVANYAVGVNNIDLEAARRRGIVISNTPDVLTGATAEVALTLMLSLLRRVTEGDRLIRRRRAVGVLARVHARREPRGEDGADRRCRADRPRDGAARRGVRCDTPSSPAATPTSMRSCRRRTSSRSTPR